MKVGAPPEVIGSFSVPFQEMMFWLYCPIKLPRSQVVFPDNLKQFSCLVHAAAAMEPEWDRLFVYLTAKRLFVSGNDIGQRHGWHTDGFGSNDVNYIWADRCPTVFAIGDLSVSSDHDQSMQDMENAAPNMQQRVYEAGQLLKLTPSVMHRSPQGVSEGIRTFVKISVSDKPYNLLGNSINRALAHLENYPWSTEERESKRNHPTRGDNQ